MPAECLILFLQYPKEQPTQFECFLYRFFQDFLAKHILSLQIKGVEDSLPPRDKDWCITDAACSDPTIPDTDIRQIYYIRAIWRWNGHPIFVQMMNQECSLQFSKISTLFRNYTKETRKLCRNNLMIEPGQSGEIFFASICETKWNVSLRLGD